MKKNRVCLVTTVLNPGPSFESFLKYHLAIGFDQIYVFFDDPADPAITTAEKIEGVVAIPCDATHRQKYESMLAYPMFKDTLNSRVQSRQQLNATIGRDLALKEKFDWILHVDCDELIYNSFNLPIAELMAQVPDDVDHVHCLNLEAVPQRIDIENPFVDVTLFKANHQIFTKKLQSEKNKIYDKYFGRPGRQYFNAHFQGKSIARVRSDIFPGIHFFVSEQDIKDSKIFQKEELSLKSVSIEGLVVYHYPNCGFAQFLSRYNLWSKALDKNNMEGLDSLAMAAYRAGDFLELEKLYKKHVQFTDKQGISKLIKEGYFVRNKKISLLIEQLLLESQQAKKVA